MKELIIKSMKLLRAFLSQVIGLVLKLFLVLGKPFAILKIKYQSTDGNTKTIFNITVYATVIAAILVTLIVTQYKSFTSNIYTAEYLSIKYHYGKLTSEEPNLANYIFLKVKFSKPWYASDKRIYPEGLTIKDLNDPEATIRTYRLVDVSDPEKIYLPRIETSSRIIGDYVYDETISSLFYQVSHPDLIGQSIMEEPSECEIFYDATEAMLQSDFILTSEKPETKIFVFRFLGKRTDEDSDHNFYELSGNNIKAPRYQFINHLAYCNMSTDSLYSDSELLGRELKNCIHKFNYTAFEKLIGKYSGGFHSSYINVFLGINELAKQNTLVGREMINNNLFLLPKDEIIDLLPYVISAHFALASPQIPSNTQSLLDLIEYGLKMMPNNTFLLNFKALALMASNAQSTDESLEIYRRLTPKLLTDDQEALYLINRAYLHHIRGENSLSNYYFEQVLNTNGVSISDSSNLGNCINAHMAHNYYILGKDGEYLAHAKKLTIDSYKTSLDSLVRGLDFHDWAMAPIY